MKKIILLLAALSGFFCAKNVWATCDITSAFTAGQTLTASQLNTFVTQAENCVNGVLDGDTFTGNIFMYSGADINVYSDTGSTLKASIDGATGAIIGGLTQAGQVTNCGISVSGSTFTIAGYDGTALSATNPCVVAVKSSTAGRVALAYFTANVTFTFGSSSDTDGNLFGMADYNWSSVMPFFIGVIYNGTTPYFTISRVPVVQSGSASTDVCQKADTDCDLQSDVMILTTGLTLSGFTTLPITQVGWFQMTYATSGSAWTATTSIQTGFNNNNEDFLATYPGGNPVGACGATSEFICNETGNVIQFSTNNARYIMHRSGVCEFFLDLEGDGGTDGSTSDTTDLLIPYVPDSTVDQAVTFGYVFANATTGSGIGGIVKHTAGTIQLVGYADSAFVNGTRDIVGNISYRIKM